MRISKPEYYLLSSYAFKCHLATQFLSIFFFQIDNAFLSERKSLSA